MRLPGETSKWLIRLDPGTFELKHKMIPARGPQTVDFCKHVCVSYSRLPQATLGYSRLL